MKLYEPFQRLDTFVYFKVENAVYIKSSINVLLPARASLISKEPVYDDKFSAILDYYYTTDNSAFEPYIFDHERLIKFIDKVALPAMNLDDKSLAAAVNNAITEQLEKAISFKVTCIVHKDKAEGGQVTNTISHQGEVIIL